MDNIVLWHASRATGLVAMLLLTLVVVLGVLGSLRVATRSWQRFAIAGIHRNLALLTVVFLALHIITSVVDTYVAIDWPDAFIPFGSDYRPVWLGMGTVASDIVLALLITSLLRPRINQRLWRAVHWAAYACWPVTVAHALGTVTNSIHKWSFGLVLGCGFLVLLVTLLRVISVREDPDGQPAEGPTAAGQSPERSAQRGRPGTRRTR
jgi:sulfoxide reductase heme-binding subunit YedZ